MTALTSAERGPQMHFARPGETRDRAAEFRRARRHSVRVRVLKGILPLLAAGILGLYVLPAALKVSVDHGKGTATVRAITVQAGSLKMIAPRVQGVNDSQGVYDVTADSATQASRDADTMFLDRVRGKLSSQDGKVSTLTAPNAVYNNKVEELTFNNGAVVNREGGMSAEFQTATVYMKQQLVVSKTPVVVRHLESTIKAQTMTLKYDEQYAVFEGNVRTHLERQPAGEAPQEGRAAGWKTESGKSE